MHCQELCIRACQLLQNVKHVELVSLDALVSVSSHAFQHSTALQALLDLHQDADVLSEWAGQESLETLVSAAAAARKEHTSIDQVRMSCIASLVSQLMVGLQQQLLLCIAQQLSAVRHGISAALHVSISRLALEESATCKLVGQHTRILVWIARSKMLETMPALLHDCTLPGKRIKVKQSFIVHDVLLIFCI